DLVFLIIFLEFNSSIILRRKADICDLVVVRIIWLEFTKYPARVDRIGYRVAGSRGSQNDRRKGDGGCLIDDDLLDVGIARRTPADHCTEPESRYEIPEHPACLRVHVHLPPFVLDVTEMVAALKPEIR